MDALLILIILFILGSTIYVIAYPFIWGGKQFNQLLKQEKLLIARRTEKEVLITKNKKTAIIELYDKTGSLLSISLDKREKFLEDYFPKEWKHAYWIEQIRTQLVNNEEREWNTLYELAWKAIRSLEKRNQFSENTTNLISEQNFDWIKRVTDKALVGLHYKSVNTKNAELISLIMSVIKELQQKQNLYSDEVHKQAIQMVIETHNKRLETQTKIMRTINLFDNDISQLKASFNLIIEGVEAEISACKLGNTRITTKWNALVLNINLSELDRIYEEHRQALQLQ